MASLRPTGMNTMQSTAVAQSYAFGGLREFYYFCIVHQEDTGAMQRGAEKQSGITAIRPWELQQLDIQAYHICAGDFTPVQDGQPRQPSQILRQATRHGNKAACLTEFTNQPPNDLINHTYPFLFHHDKTVVCMPCFGT